MRIMRKSFEKETVLFILLLIGCIILYLYRISWGMADVDESFYLTIPLRLLQGDALLTEEWHVSQLSAVIVYPILKLYLLCFKTTDGIMIAFRYIYVIFHTLTTIIAYLILRKRDGKIAVSVSILFFIFTPFNIMSLSYNTLGLDMVFIFAAALAVSKGVSIKNTICLGTIFALAVLCNPYLSVLYLLYCGYVFNRIKRTKETDELRKWSYLTLGIGGVLAVF